LFFMCEIFLFSHPQFPKGGLAQLARALAWHARGHRFDSDILHNKNTDNRQIISLLSVFFLSGVKHFSFPFLINISNE